MPSSLIATLRSNLPTDIDVPARLGEDDQRNLLHALVAVPDPRDRRGVRYRLTSLLAVAVCAVLAQLTIAAKSNEIPAFTPLLDQVKAILGSLTGVVIVADALHAQVAHATDLHERGAHLMVTVKANQPTLLHQLKTLPWAQVSVGHRTSDRDRKSTRLNSSHLVISYAVFCLKKKNKTLQRLQPGSCA